MNRCDIFNVRGLIVRPAVGRICRMRPRSLIVRASAKVVLGKSLLSTQIRSCMRTILSEELIF